MKQSSFHCLLILSSSSSSSRLFSLVFFLCNFLLVAAMKATTKLPSNESVPALIVFGDSIVDAGNNNDLRTLVKCNFLPYGVDFHGGVPTGRFCDGKVPSDIVAEKLGIKPVVPAYLDPNLKPEDLLTGVTFASGGTGYDSLTPKLVSVLPLSDQLNYFEEYIEKLKGIAGEERTNFILEKSIYFVVAGSNDIANTYFVLRARKLQYDVPSYTDLMASSASDFVNKLYGHGARRIGVFGAPPIGCVPSQRTLAGGLTRDCAENYNEAAMLFNSKLSAKLDSMSRTLHGIQVVYIDVYTPLFDLIRYPKKYGFEVADKGCCGTGNEEMAVLCNRYSSSTCSNVSAHVFWDSYHPTERAYRVLTTQILDKYVHKFF